MILSFIQVMSQKLPSQPRFFLYSKLNENDTKKLGKAITNVQTRFILAQIFKIDSNQVPAVSGGSSKVSEIVLDFHFNNFQFSREQRFNNQKLSTLVGILDYTFEYSMKAGLNSDISFKNFKQILLRHSVHRPPRAMAIFSLSQVKAITEYVLKTFYRHYSFYEYILRPRVSLQMQCIDTIPALLPPVSSLEGIAQIKPQEIEDLREYVEQEGDGKSVVEEDESDEIKLERILMEQMQKITGKMERKLEQIDTKLHSKVTGPSK